MTVEKISMLNGINFEEIKLKFKNILGISVSNTKTDNSTHNEAHLKLEQSSQSLTRIEKQVVINMSAGLSEGKQREFAKELLDEGEENDQPLLEPSNAQGEPNQNKSEEKKSQLLKQRLADYNLNNELLLDRGALLDIYKDREDFSYDEEELVFLMQSSIKNDFPFWYWAFYYRENFENVVPLLRKSYNHPSLKIRKGIIDTLNGFTNTSEEIVSLAESERDPEVIGHITSIFAKKKSISELQRVVANSLTRNIVPIVHEQDLEKLSGVEIDLGKAEKRFLYKQIKEGWPEEKLKALSILSISAEEEDLPVLEELLEAHTNANISDLILVSIKKIGKTNKVDKIEKDLRETRRIETFFVALETLSAVGHKAIFPDLLKWLSDTDWVTNRMWGEVNDSKVDDALQNAIVDLLDKETYEMLVDYILNKYSPDEHGNIMSWRHFWLLRDSKKKEEILDLIKKETRLDDFEKWSDVLSEAKIETQKTEVDLLEMINSDDYDLAVKAVRKLAKTATPEWVFENLTNPIEGLRKNLRERLEQISQGDHPEEVMDIVSENDLENFLGENRSFYRISRKKKSRYEIEGEEDEDFKKLSKDIESFDSIETAYLKHIFTSNDPRIREKMFLDIGRPYECIYKLLTIETADSSKLQEALEKVIESDPNPLIQLDAIDTMRRLELGSAENLRQEVLSILLEARNNLKKSKGVSEDYEDWYVYELTYGWATNSLSEFGNIDDFSLIEEAVNREKILWRHFHKYAKYFDFVVFKKLLHLTENLEDPKEKEQASRSLEDLDYLWTKEVLGIDE